MTRIALLFGGRSVEHKVSVVSARTVGAALESAGFEVAPFGIALDGAWSDPAESAAALAGERDVLPATGGPVPPSLGPFLAAQVDAAFPVVHGTWGEDGTLQGLLEMLEIPYVGAGVTASAVAMDKLLCKRLLREVGLPVLEFEAVSRLEFERAPEGVLERLRALPMPVFVKPSVGGSSVGIHRVESPDCLATSVAFALRFDDAVVVERGVNGRELECSVLGYPELEASAVGEIVPGNDFYDYEDKYLQDEAELRVPAPLEPAVEERVRRLAVAAFRSIGGTGMGRVDFLLEDERDLFVSEINTLPGFTDISMYPKLWHASGLEISDLVRRLVEDALARHADRRRLDEGIKSWVAELEGG